MFIAYVVMVQNDDYPVPQVCGDGGDSANDASYATVEEANQFIDWMVEYNGFDREDYFIAKLEKI